MKNKKKLFIIGGSAISIILAVVLCIVLIPKHGEEKPTESEPTESSNSTVVIDEPVSETQSTETNSINEEEKIDDDGNGLLKPEVEDGTAEKSETTGEKAKEPNKVITEQPVSKDEGDTGAIQIGGGESAAYSCGDANHHCENAEYHAYIKNLELAGCPYCGSHSCNLIEAADRKSTSARRMHITKWAGLAAACFVLAIMTVIGAGVLNRSPDITPDTTPGSILEKHFPVGSDSEIAKEIPMDWDTMIDTQRFPTISFSGHEFTTNLIAVHAENEGELLGTATMTGSYIKNGEATGEFRTIDVKVYAIRGIDTDVAVAVRFNETDKYSYAYSDDWYTPATLGDFVEKLNLAEYMKTGLCFYENGVGSDSETIVYEDIDTSTVWSMLLDDLTVKNEPDFTPGQKVMSISVNVDVLGNHNKSISLTEDGYLCTNLLESGKYFFIGKDKVETFVNEVTSNHQGYRYIYDLTEYDEVAE